MTFLFSPLQSSVFKRQENLNDSIFVNSFIPVHVANRRCNRSRHWHGQIVKMHGYISNFVTAMLSYMQCQLISLSHASLFFLCEIMCKPGLTGLHGSYAPALRNSDGAEAVACLMSNLKMEYTFLFSSGK